MGGLSGPITVVFVLSANRSGSTWLNLVLGSCSWAQGLGEYRRPWVKPGHVACRLCEADGRPRCTLLDGIERVARSEAFHFAAARSAKPVLIDCSKDLDWCRGFLDRPDIDARLIHLVRHPCGFVESESRRNPRMRRERLLDQWESVNRRIGDFVSATPAPCRLACYDDLADDPAGAFPDLCRFIGRVWEPAALRYWEVPHHGLGGNGASSVYLRGRKVDNFLTGDDGFYDGIADRPTAADSRFRQRLPEDFRRRAVERPYARSLRARLGGAPWQA